MKILFLTNLLPYPLDNGGRIKTYSSIRALHTDGNTVDLLCFYEQKDLPQEYIEEVKKYCNSVECIYTRLTTSGNKGYMLKMAFLSLFSPLSFGLYKYKNDEMNSIISEYIEKNKYHLVYFDHLQLCVYYNLIKGKVPKIKCLLDEHNCEYLIMKRHYENAVNPVKKLFLKIEYKKLMHFESKMLQQMDKVITLSEEDNKYLQKITKHEFKSEIIPICIDEHIRKDVAEHDNTVVKMLFLGTMTWEPNRSGLLWFLKNVIPQIKAKGINYSLHIVGKNPSEEIIKLANSDNDIHVAGYVEDTEVYFRKCDCMIVPLFVGSGQRVKIIESLSRGFPVISTSVGAEGLVVSDNESILLADTSDEYICALQKLQHKDVYEKISEQSYMVYKKYYSFEAVKKRIAECVMNTGVEN